MIDKRCIDCPCWTSCAEEYNAVVCNIKRARPFTFEEVAQILADACGDYCACNMNGNDEWLPQKCAFGQTDCPDPPERLDCWKQYLLHIKEKEL